MFRATPETTLAAYLTHHFLAAKNLRPTSRFQYEVQLRNLQKFADSVRQRELAAAHAAGVELADDPARALTLGDLSDELVYGAMQWQVSSGLSATTANKLRRHINAIWNLACEAEILSKRPRNKPYRANVAEPIALMPDELDKLLEAASLREGYVGEVPAGQWWMTAILFVYSLGARITAAYEVQTARLDLDRGEVVLTAETQKQRREQRLDLFPGVVYWLRELRLKERGVRTVLGDWPFQIGALRKHYTRLFVEAGLYQRAADVPRNLKFHALRKTLASQLFAAGGMPAACERMGHSSTQVTERYIDPRYKRQVRINELVKDPSPARLAKPILKIHRGEAG